MVLPLPTVTAVSFNRSIKTGRNAPGIFTCANEQGAEEDYVVKFRNTQYMERYSSCFEALAYQLATHFELPVPSAAVVEIPDTLIPVHASAIGDVISANVGNNFGTRFLYGGYHAISRQSSLQPTAREIALDVIAFDGLIANFDRSVQNPNILWANGGFVLLDHELAFRFLFDALWKANWYERLYFLHNHVMAHVLRRRYGNLNFNRFRTALLNLTDARLAEIKASLPSTFGNEYVDDICAQLSRTRDEADAFLQAVWRRIR